MRGLFARSDPVTRNLLFIESGERFTADLALERLYRLADVRRLDVLTCYGTPPESFQAHRGTILSVHSEEAVRQRRSFLDRLAHGPYDATVLVCSGSGVLAKWKWSLAALSRSPLMIVDERGEWFFLNFRNPGPLAAMLIRRSNLASIPDGLFAAIKILAVPFTISFLIAYAISVHAKRLLRLHFHRPS